MYESLPTLYITRVAVGRLPELRIFGGDWPTPDGSGVRDYIYVMDLAEGHVAALRHLLAQPPQLLTLNLGRGCGISVLELVHAFERASGRSLPCTMAGRRPGDIAPPPLRLLGRRHPVPPRCWAGVRSATSMPCAATPGAGNRPTPTATAAEL